MTEATTTTPDWRSLRLVRRPLRSTLRPTDVARALPPHQHAFALAGSWFDGGAVFGSAPTMVRSSETDHDPFELLDQLPDLSGDEPGVYGGWVGYLGYQTGNLIERLPGPPPRPSPLPTWWLAWHDHVVRFDLDTGWWFEAMVTDTSRPRMDDAFREWQARLAGAAPPISHHALSSFVATPDGDDHRKAVRRALDHIMAGDIYQANVCLRLSATLEAGHPVDLFAAGIDRVDPRFGAYLDLGGRRAVVSLSPELFLRRRGLAVTTAPIKGTRPRMGSESHDLATAPKDRAENVMIVDLMRNDLGRVCVPGSISVPRLFDVEPHPGVWHLVSEVVGELRAEVADGGLMRATMPPGSVTGAPKVRAMEVIAEVETTGREVYTGAIGIVSPVAGADWNVAIRTFEVADDDVWMGVGGGIVADSDPAAELAECITKASPLIEALGATLVPISRGRP